MNDLLAKFDPIIEQREMLLSTGLTDPFGLVMERVESPTVAICNGKRTILLGTYNYMGMTFDPDVVAAGKQALDEFGSGTTGSRVLNGTYQGHKECEAALRDFYAMDHAMVFSTAATSWPTVSISACMFMLMMMSKVSSTSATKSITVRLSHSRSPAKVVASVSRAPFLLKGPISPKIWSRRAVLMWCVP